MYSAALAPKAQKCRVYLFSNRNRSFIKKGRLPHISIFVFNQNHTICILLLLLCGGKMRKFNVLHVTETYWRLVSGCPCLITVLQFTGIIYVGRVGLVCPGHTAQAQWLSPGNLHGNRVRITKDDITKGTS